MKFLAPRWRKVFRDMSSNSSRTLLVIMSIAVGVIAIGVVSGSQSVLVKSLNESYNSVNPAHAVVSTRTDFGDDLADTLDSMREIERAAGRRQFLLPYKLNGLGEWRNLQLTAYEDYDELEISKVMPEQGQWPPPDRKILLERRALDLVGAQIGDQLVVEIDTNRTKTLQIVGTVHDQSSPPANLAGTPTGFITRDTLEWLDQPSDHNQLLFMVAEQQNDRAHRDQIGDLVRDKIEKAGGEVRTVTIFNPGEHPVSIILEPLLYLLTALGILCVILSGFLVINTISALVTQQRRQIGIMKSIGATQGNITVLYFVTVMVYGFLALVVAIPSGIFGATLFTNFLANFFNNDIEAFVMPNSVLALQIGIGLIAPILAAIYPILAGVRVTVREAISDYGMGTGQLTPGLIDRLLQSIRGLSRPLMISLRNTFRRKSRLILTLATLSLAGMIFIIVLTIRDSMFATLTESQKSWNYDFEINFEESYRLKKIEQVFQQFDITGAEGWMSEPITRVRPDGRESDSFTLLAVPAETDMLTPTLIEGRWLLPDDTNALVVNTNVTDDEPDLKVGDDIVLNIDDKESTWQVVGRVKGTLFQSYAYANYPYYALQIAHRPGKVSTVKLTTATTDLTVQKQLGQTMERQLEGTGLKVNQTRLVSELLGPIREALNFFATLLIAMALVMAVVGALGLTGTMSINVLERLREIGVVRAIGASDGAVLRMVIVEGIVIGLLSWMIGALIALPSSVIICDQIGNLMLSQPLNYVFSLMGVLIWLIASMILAMIASFLPARSASRLTVREVLAYE